MHSKSSSLPATSSICSRMSVPRWRGSSHAISLATLSNGNADLARIGLAEFFALSLNARQIGVGKPHPRCFEALASGLGLKPHDIVYVGDDPLLDVEAARSAGLSTAWVSRFGYEWPDAITPADIVVHDCLQLAEALGV